MDNLRQHLRPQAHEAIARSSFLDALEAVPIPLCLVDADRIERWGNTLFRTQFSSGRCDGTPDDGPLNFTDRFVEADRRRVEKFLSQPPGASPITATLQSSNSGERTVLLNNGPVASSGDSVRCIAVQAFREIDEYTRAMNHRVDRGPETDRSSPNIAPSIAGVADTLPIPVWAIDHDDRVVLWNIAAERLMGLGKRQVMHRGPSLLREVGIRAEPKPGGPRVLDPENEAAVRLTTPDGTARWIRWFTIGDAWSVRGWKSWGIGLDVTEQYTAFRALQESERRYRDILRNVDLAGIMVDENERVLYLNDHLLNLGGWTESSLLGVPWRKAFCDTSGAHIDAGALGRVLSLVPFDGRAEGTLVTATGEQRFLVWTQSLYRDIDGKIVGACALGMDITDHKRNTELLSDHRDHLEQLVGQRSRALAESERRLRDAERLAALGQLSAGVSHDMGNMLLPVRCHIDRIRGEAMTDGQRASLDAVSAEIEFLDHLGEGLDLLSGSGSTQQENRNTGFEDVPLRAWWSEVSPLFRGMIPPEVSISEHADEELPAVRIPRHLLTRATMNLVTNAVEAVARRTRDDGESRIEFSLRNQGDRSVCIAVADNGPGITDSVRHRAADPFFTTKTRSLSTGLGLSVARGVARMAGGTLDLISRDDGGAVAVLVFPKAPDTPSPGCPSESRLPVVAIEIDQPRVAAICAVILGSLPCKVSEESGDADLVLRLSRLSGKGRESPREVLIDPAAGIKAMKAEILKEFNQWKRDP